MRQLRCSPTGGYRTLLVESRDRVGGRASSRRSRTVTRSTRARSRSSTAACSRQVSGRSARRSRSGSRSRRLCSGSGPRHLAREGSARGDRQRRAEARCRVTAVRRRTDAVKRVARRATRKNETVHAIFRNLCAAIFAGQQRRAAGQGVHDLLPPEGRVPRLRLQPDRDARTDAGPRGHGHARCGSTARSAVLHVHEGG